MKGGALVIASLLGGAGCAPMATTRNVTAPDGVPAIFVECRQESRCIGEAQRVCPGGYLVLDAGAREGHVVRRGIAAPIYQGQMLIRCQ